MRFRLVISKILRGVYLFEYRTRLIRQPLTSRELSDQKIHDHDVTAAERPTRTLYRRTFAKDPDLFTRDLEYLEARSPHKKPHIHVNKNVLGKM